jgi:sporulation protein YlmC with PRC-barrel domain
MGTSARPVGADAVPLLSELVGWRVLSRAGDHLGRVADASVVLGPAHPPLHRLLVRLTRRTTRLVPCVGVTLDPVRRVVQLGGDTALQGVGPHEPQLEDGELLLRRDVLDTQVVDLAGHRLARVSDVLLRMDGNRVTVQGVDLGTGALLRRIGLGALVADDAGVIVDWPDLHLTSPRGHAVQLGLDEASFRTLDAPGLAQLLTRLSTSAATDVVRASEPAEAAAALHRSHHRTARRLVHALSPDERERLLTGAEDEHARTIRRIGVPEVPAPRRVRRTAGWRLHRPPEG